MNRSVLLKPLVYLMFFILFLYAGAQKFHWDYSIWWFDALMHFLGGFWQGVFSLWFFSEVRLPFLRRPIRGFSPETLVQALAYVLFVGIAWEAGEFLTSNYIGLEPFSILDTTSDVLFDLAGGALALVYSFKKVLSAHVLETQKSS